MNGFLRLITTCVLRRSCRLPSQSKIPLLWLVKISFGNVILEEFDLPKQIMKCTITYKRHPTKVQRPVDQFYQEDFSVI